jgi:hypothetical protein
MKHRARKFTLLFGMVLIVAGLLTLLFYIIVKKELILVIAFAWVALAFFAVSYHYSTLVVASKTILLHKQSAHYTAVFAGDPTYIVTDKDKDFCIRNLVAILKRKGNLLEIEDYKIVES